MSRPRKPGRKTKGFRDRLVSELQAKGFHYAIAKRAVRAMFDLIKRALVDKEPVEVPGVGRLVVRPAKQQRFLIFHKIVDIPKYPWRISLRCRPTEPRRRRPASPGKEGTPKKVISHRRALISVVPYKQRHDVPSRTAMLEPRKR